MTIQNKIALGLLLAAVLAVVVFMLITNNNSDTSEAAAPQEVEVILENSHRLSEAPNEKAVLVEFLDFECEACLAAYPIVEDIAAEYADELTIAARYFPLPGHPNSETAAIAVEAAAQQGKFKEMHSLMYETQTEWSHTAEDRAPVFRTYAEQLGLDMDAYDAAVEDPATAARIAQDKSDGLALGVEGTPTFFLDGEKIEPAGEVELRQLIEAAINK